MLGRKALGGACLGVGRLGGEQERRQRLKPGRRVLLIPRFWGVSQDHAPPPGQSGLSCSAQGPWGLLAEADDPMTVVRLMAGAGWLHALLCHRGGAGRASMAVPELSLVPGPHVSAV